MESPKVDLQAVSIDPVRPSIKKGSSTTVVANMRNNGPDPIPAGEAKVHVTVNGQFLNKPAGFKSIIPGEWILEVIKTENGNHELFARNAKPIPVTASGFPGFKFTVKRKAAGTAQITLASSLSGTATASDVDGANQSCSTEIN